MEYPFHAPKELSPPTANNSQYFSLSLYARYAIEQYALACKRFDALSQSIVLEHVYEQHRAALLGELDEFQYLFRIYGIVADYVGSVGESPYVAMVQKELESLRGGIIEGEHKKIFQQIRKGTVHRSTLSSVTMHSTVLHTPCRALGSAEAYEGTATEQDGDKLSFRNIQLADLYSTSNEHAFSAVKFSTHLGLANQDAIVALVFRMTVVITTTAFSYSYKAELHTPTVEMSSRPLREFGARHFIRVSFVHIPAAGMHTHAAVQRKLLHDAVHSILIDGFFIAGSYWLYLTQSASQVRAQQCWFVTAPEYLPIIRSCPRYLDYLERVRRGHAAASTSIFTTMRTTSLDAVMGKDPFVKQFMVLYLKKRSALFREYIVAWLGDIMETWPCKYSTRRGIVLGKSLPTLSLQLLSFSQLYAVRDIGAGTVSSVLGPLCASSAGSSQLIAITEKDYTYRDYKFTDGCGEISYELMLEVGERLYELSQNKLIGTLSFDDVNVDATPSTAAPTVNTVLSCVRPDKPSRRVATAIDASAMAGQILAVNDEDATIDITDTNTDATGATEPAEVRAVKPVFKVPSAVQFRYLGYKGVLCLNMDLEGRMVIFRESQKKFVINDPTPVQATLEILSASDVAPAYLNAQIIVLLADLGVPFDVFKTLIVEDFQRWGMALPGSSSIVSSDMDKITNLIRKMRGKDSARLLLKMILAGVPLSDPVAIKLLTDLQCMHVSTLKKTFRILVHESASLIGVYDVFGLLHEGEVCLGVSGMYTLNSGEWPRSITGTVVIAKNPCVYIGDVRKFVAVDLIARHLRLKLRRLMAEKPEKHSPPAEGVQLTMPLEESPFSDTNIYATAQNYLTLNEINRVCAMFRGVVVFPRHFDGRPHPDELGGADLDGDRYFCCWHRGIVSHVKENAKPAEFQPRPGEIPQTLIACIDDSAEVTGKDRDSEGPFKENNVAGTNNADDTKVRKNPGMCSLPSASERARMVAPIDQQIISWVCRAFFDATLGRIGSLIKIVGDIYGYNHFLTIELARCFFFAVDADKTGWRFLGNPLANAVTSFRRGKLRMAGTPRISRYLTRRFSQNKTLMLRPSWFLSADNSSYYAGLDNQNKSTGELDLQKFVYYRSESVLGKIYDLLCQWEVFIYQAIPHTLGACTSLSDSQAVLCVSDILDNLRRVFEVRAAILPERYCRNILAGFRVLEPQTEASLQVQALVQSKEDLAKGTTLIQMLGVSDSSFAEVFPWVVQFFQRLIEDVQRHREGGYYETVRTYQGYLRAGASDDTRRLRGVILYHLCYLFASDMLNEWMDSQGLTQGSAREEAECFVQPIHPIVTGKVDGAHTYGQTIDDRPHKGHHVSDGRALDTEQELSGSEECSSLSAQRLSASSDDEDQLVIQCKLRQPAEDIRAMRKTLQGRAFEPDRLWPLDVLSAIHAMPIDEAVNPAPRDRGSDNDNDSDDDIDMVTAGEAGTQEGPRTTPSELFLTLYNIVPSHTVPAVSRGYSKTNPREAKPIGGTKQSVENEGTIELSRAAAYRLENAHADEAQENTIAKAFQLDMFTWEVIDPILLSTKTPMYSLQIASVKKHFFNKIRTFRSSQLVRPELASRYYYPPDLASAIVSDCPSSGREDVLLTYADMLQDLGVLRYSFQSEKEKVLRKLEQTCSNGATSVDGDDNESYALSEHSALNRTNIVVEITSDSSSDEEPPVKAQEDSSETILDGQDSVSDGSSCTKDDDISDIFDFDQPEATESSSDTDESSTMTIGDKAESERKQKPVRTHARRKRPSDKKARFNRIARDLNVTVKDTGILSIQHNTSEHAPQGNNDHKDRLSVNLSLLPLSKAAILKGNYILSSTQEVMKQGLEKQISKCMLWARLAWDVAGSEICGCFARASKNGYTDFISPDLLNIISITKGATIT